MSTETASPPDRLLVVKLSSLGDLFHALPAVHRLKQHTGAAIDWVTQPEYVDLVGCFTDVDDVIAFPRRACLTKGGGFLRVLRRQEYRLGIDLQGLLKSAAIIRAARCGQRIGPFYSREGAHLLYHRTVGTNESGQHAVDRLLQVADDLVPDPGPVEFPVRFPAFPLDVPGPVVGLAPCSRWPAKDWPAPRFIDVARALQQQRQVSICLVGGPGDQAVCRQIADGLDGPVRNLAGTTSLVELGGALANMDVLVSVDSGPMHMAAALGRPVLALFGVTDPARTGPYGEQMHSLLSPDLVDHPRLARAFKDDQLHGQWDLPTEDVVAAALALLGSADSARHPASPAR